MQKPQAVSGTFLNLESSFPGGCPTDLEDSIGAFRRTGKSQCTHPPLASFCSPRDTDTGEARSRLQSPWRWTRWAPGSLFHSASLYSDPKVPVRGIPCLQPLGETTCLVQDKTTEIRGHCSGRSTKELVPSASRGI